MAIRPRVFLAVLAGLSLSLATPAAEAPLEEATDQLDRMRKHLSAVSNRFEGGMKVRRRSAETDQPATPALECCEANLKVVQDRLIGFNRAILKLAACYEQSEDRDGMTRVARVRTDSEALRRGLEAFVRATSRDKAGGAMAGTTRAFLGLDKDFKLLEPCGLPDETPLTEPEHPTSEPSAR